MAERKTLLLPVVIAKRELDGNLLLGLVAAARKGYRVVIGLRHNIDNTARYRDALYLAKNVRQNFIMDRPAAQGHSIIAMDEEGLVRFPAHVQSVRYQSRSLSLPRLLLAWGEDNADYWRQLPHYTGTPIAVTGNPCADLLRPGLREIFRKEADEIQAKFGPFILLNTNFSLVNHFMPKHRSFRPPGFFRKDFQAVWKGLEAHKTTLMERFLALVPELAAAIAPNRLVVRPHPSENPEPWNHAAASAPNIHIVQQGAIQPWLLASAGVLHNGCTSAVEAAMLGKQPYAYQPVASSQYDLRLPNEISISCASSKELIARLRAGLATEGTVDGSETLSRLDKHVGSLSGPLACERILAAIEENSARLEGDHAAPAASRIVSKASVVIDGFLSRTAERKYNAHIFPELHYEKLATRAKELMQLLKIDREVKMQLLSSDVIQLEA